MTLFSVKPRAAEVSRGALQPDALAVRHPRARHAQAQLQRLAALQHEHLAHPLDELALVRRLIERPAALAEGRHPFGKTHHVRVKTRPGGVVERADEVRDLVALEIDNRQIEQIGLEREPAEVEELSLIHI